MNGIEKNQAATRLYFTLFSVLTLTLLIHYRKSGGDIYLYTVAGEKILAGENPYLNSEFANSPIGAILVLFVSKIIPAFLFAWTIQVLNVLGIISFIRLLQKKSSDFNLLGFAILGLALSVPYRALIANLQVSGIILGLFSVATLFMERKSILLHFCAFALIGIGIELKPQVALPFALIFWYRHWNGLQFIITSAIFAFSHIFISFRFGGVVELLWFEKITKFSAKSLFPGPEISVWKLFNYAFDQETAIKLLSSSLVCVFYLCFILIRKKSDSVLFLFAATAPLITSYSHMYDLVALVLIIGFNKFIPFSAKTLLILLLVVPPQTDPKVFFALFAIALVLICASLPFSNISKFRIGVIYGLNALLIVFLGSSFSGGDVELELSIRLMALIPLMAWYVRKATLGLNPAHL